MYAAESIPFEVALKDAGTENAVRAIVDVLKEIANALDEVERRAERTGKGITEMFTHEVIEEISGRHLGELRVRTRDSER